MEWNKQRIAELLAVVCGGVAFTVPFKTWERLRQLCAGCLAFSVPSFWAERWPLF